MPEISVITPSYNRAGFIREAIESVQAQSFRDWELIVVDDASTDDTESVVSEFVAKDGRIRYLKNATNLKISLARNRGLEAATGRYVAVLDSDDLWCDPDKLRKQCDFLDENPDHAVIGGAIVLIDVGGKEIGRYRNPLSDRELRASMLMKNQIVHSSVLYRRQVAVELGEYDKDFSSIEDYDMWLKIGRKHRLANLPDFVTKYRVHGGNISVRERARQMENNITLINKYRYDYPSYARALVRRTLRLWAYRALAGFLPKAS